MMKVELSTNQRDELIYLVDKHIYEISFDSDDLPTNSKRRKHLLNRIQIFTKIKIQLKGVTRGTGILNKTNGEH